MTRKRLIVTGAITLLWIAFLTGAALLNLRHPYGGGDFDAYYLGAQRLINGQPLYIETQTAAYIYPPILAQAILPIVALFDEDTASLVWFALNVAMLFATLHLLGRYLANDRQRALLWIATVFFLPTLMTFWLGQITIVLFALTTGAWVAYKEDKPALTGVLLAVAVWTKFYPGLFLVYFLWKREWRVVMSAMITTLVVVGVQVAISGLDTFIGYFTDILPALLAEGQPQINHSNNALLGFLQRLFMQNPQVIPLVESPFLLTISRFGLMALLLSVTVYLITFPKVRLSETAPGKFDLEYSLVLLVALLFGSTLGVHGMLSLLLVYVIILRSAASQRERTHFAAWCFVSGTLISLHIVIILGYLLPPSENTLPALALSLPFFGMMIALALTMALLRRSLNTEPVSTRTPEVQAAIESGLG